MTYTTDRACAQRLDAADPLAGYAQHFYKTPGLYMESNGLGLMCRQAEQSLQRVADEWRIFACDGWMAPEQPWFFLPERLAGAQAQLVGAQPESLVLAGTTTTNLHSTLATFYRPQGERRRLLVDALNFPSDRYAAESQVLLQGGDPSRDLVVAPSADGWTLRESDIVACMDERVAVALLPSVLHQSGQLLDLPLLTKEAHARGILIGFDLSHSVGVVPHHLDEIGVDFAVWCNYKYLNGGPGCPATIYINERHFGRRPALAGWHGYDKNRQFSMLPEFEAARGAGGWQHGSPHILNMAPLEGAQQLVLEAGIGALRQKSLALTGYFLYLYDQLLQRHGLQLATPREEMRRGGHITLLHPAARAIGGLLESHTVPDAPQAEAVRQQMAAFEGGDYTRAQMIRIPFAPLYTSFEEVYEAASGIAALMKLATSNG